MRYTIYPLKVGEWIDPEPRIFYLGDCSKSIRLFNYFWLVKGGKYNILVDSGVTLKDGIKINPYLKQTDDEHPIKQLRKYKITPMDITHVILTHAHWDHLSPVILEYKNAEIYLQEKEWNAVLHSQHPWFSKFVFIDALKGLKKYFRKKFHIINGDARILPGIKVFLTGGHTPGSQAVSIQTEKGKTIITGDVVFTYRNLNKDIPCGFNSNLTECFLAMERIKKNADIIFPSHDPLVLNKVRDK